MTITFPENTMKYKNLQFGAQKPPIKFEIRKLLPPDYSLPTARFARDYFPLIETNRPQVIQAVEKLTGLQIHDFGNFSNEEMKLLLVSLIWTVLDSVVTR